MDKDSISFVAAAGGWIVALVTLLLGYRERQAAREEERLGKTLDYFDGGSQKRSIGISLLEGVWLKNSRYHPVLAPLVANQIVYLLLSTDSHDPHNERNLIRLLDIFARIPDVRANYSDRWKDVCDAISRKYAGEPKGIPMEKPTLRALAQRLGHQMGEA
jgi:hypothetical protein